MKKLYRFPGVIILLILGITVFFGFQLKKVTLNNDIAAFIPEKNEKRAAFCRIDEEFGSQLVMVIGLRTDSSSIFTVENLRVIKELSDAFGELAYIEEVQSLSSASFISGNSEGLVVNPLIDDDFSGSEEEIAALKNNLMSWDVYRKSLLSDDFRSTQIILTLAEEAVDDSAFYNDIKTLLENHALNGLEYYLAGQPVVAEILSLNMKKDIAFLVPFVVILVSLILALAFRRFSGVILPLLTVLISTIWTIGMMALLKVSLSMVSTIIPVLMIAVGSAYGIHLVTHYYDEMREGKVGLSRDEHTELVFNTLRKVGPAILMAGITTVIGFGALSFSQIQPMKDFGIFTALGVLEALIVTLLLIPSILILRHKPLKNTPRRSQIKTDRLETFLLKILRRKGAVLFLAAAVVLISIYGACKVITDNNMVKYFKPETEVSKADAFLNSEFSGTNIFSLVLTSDEKGAFLDPVMLKRIDDLQAWLKDEFPEIGGVLSLTDMVKRMNKIMHWEDESTGGQTEEILSDDSWSVSDFSSAFEGDFHSGFNADDSSDDSWGFSDFSSFSSDSTEAERTRDTEEPLSAPATMADVLSVINSVYTLSDSAHISTDDLITLINRQTNYQGERYNEIPLDPQKYGLETRDDLKNLISQYFLLYSGNTDSFMDSPLEPSKIKVTVQMKSSSSVFSNKVQEAVEEYIEKNFPPSVKTEISGIAVLAGETTNLVTKTQKFSILISLILVFLVLILFFRSWEAGCIGIIPLGFSILVNFGVMGFFGIRLDISTAMIASIAIGIGIDYTIHFLSIYRRERLISDNRTLVTAKTIRTSGKAIIFNAVSVAAGFSVLLFSRFNPLAYLGALIALNMATSSFAAMIILPAIIHFREPKFLSAGYPGTKKTINFMEEGK